MKPNNKQTKKLQKLVLGLATIFAGAVLCTNGMAGVIGQPSPSGSHMGVGDGGFIPSSQTLNYLKSAHNPMPGAGPSNEPHQGVPDMNSGNTRLDLLPYGMTFVNSAQLDPFAEDALHSWVALETWSPTDAKADLIVKTLRHNARVESMQSTEVDQLQKISLLLTAICASDAHCKIADAGL